MAGEPAASRASFAEENFILSKAPEQSRLTTWDWEGAKKQAEVVLAKQEHLPAYRMRIVKAHIGRKRTAGTAFTLDSGHRNVVSGLYYVNRQGETHICLVNETAEEAVIGDSELLGEHVPVKANDMITIGELLMVHSSERTQQAGPSKEKEQLIEDTVSGQRHLSQRRTFERFCFDIMRQCH